MNPAFIGPILEVGAKLIDRMFPDPAAREQANLELLKLQREGALKELDAGLQLALGQIDVNKQEAASSDPYTSRWRPTIGYVLAAALGFQYIVNPLILWGAALAGSNITVPDIGLDEHMWELIMGMLGLAGWRTLDKVKGRG